MKNVRLRLIRSIGMTVALAVVTCLALAANVSPAMAVGFTLENSVDITQPNLYHVGDSILYAESASNINTVTAEAAVSFRQPDRSTYVSLDPMSTWVAGEKRSYTTSWTVTGLEPFFATAAGDRIASRLIVTGFDRNGDRVDALADKSSYVLKPGIEVFKYVDFDGDGVYSDWAESSPSGLAAWRIVITNTGNCPLTVDLSDSEGYDFGAPFVMARNEVKTFDYCSMITADTENIVTAVAQDELAGPNGTITVRESAFADVLDAMVDVAKTVDFDGDGEFSECEMGYAGQATWRIVAVNGGTMPLTDVVLTDGGLTFGPYSLEPGQGVSETYTTSVSADTTNTVTAVGSAGAGLNVRDSDHAYADVVAPGIDVEKSVSRDVVRASETVTWTVVVTNTGDSKLAGVTLSDTDGHAYGDAFDLASGETRTFAYTSAPAAATSTRVTASGLDLLGGIVTDSDDACVDVISPALTISKLVDFDGDGRFSEVETDYPGLADWAITVTNTGDVPLVGVMISDSNGKSFGPYSLVPGASVTECYTTTVSATTVNHACATGNDPVGDPVTTSGSATAVVQPADGSLAVEKMVDFNGDGIYSADEETRTRTFLPGTPPIPPKPTSPALRQKNTSTASVMTAYLKTAHIGASSDTFRHENDNGGLSDEVVWHFVLTGLDRGTPSGVITVQFRDAGTRMAYGRVVGSGSMQHFYVGTSSDDVLLSASVQVNSSTYRQLALSHIAAGTGDGSADATLTPQPARACWKVIVTNDGAVPMTNIMLADSARPSFGEPFTLAPGESREFCYATDITEDTTNTVCVTGADPLGRITTRSDWAAARFVTGTPGSFQTIATSR